MRTKDAVNRAKDHIDMYLRQVERVASGMTKAKMVEYFARELAVVFGDLDSERADKAVVKQNLAAATGRLHNFATIQKAVEGLIQVRIERTGGPAKNHRQPSLFPSLAPDEGGADADNASDFDAAFADVVNKSEAICSYLEELAEEYADRTERADMLRHLGMTDFQWEIARWRK